MNNIRGKKIPSQLEYLEDEIAKTAIPAITIVPNQAPTFLTDSKFGGIPYLPKNLLYPKDLNGTPMKLLAQINFAQLPPIAPFPTQGILQFFLSPNILHIEAKNHQEIFQHFFKVRYYLNTTEQLKANAEVNPPSQLEFINFPISEELSLKFTETTEPISALDYRLSILLGKNFFEKQYNLDGIDLMEDVYMQYYLGAGNKIGGYPYFLQKDIRSNSQLLKRYDTLLLQIDSNDALGIMWGDSGVANFFINREKLLKRDFSDILFHWEQY